MKNNDLPYTHLLPPLMTRMVTDQFVYARSGEPETGEHWPNVAAREQAPAPQRTRWALPWIRLPRLAGASRTSRLPASSDPV